MTFPQLGPIENLDPALAWQELPNDQPWDLQSAAHLYRRAGFGMPGKAVGEDKTSWEQLQVSIKQGRAKAIDTLLSGAAGQERFDRLMDTLGDRISKKRGPTYAPGPQTQSLQGWWLYRMLHTPHPLQERMTLFWHDHFATSVAKVNRLELMYRQNSLLREHALGDFRKMLHEMGRDPAMLIWLDGNNNIAGRPNENYARELMELFSLGVGNYTEQDIREAARAFTGWSMVGGEFVFDKTLHDAKPKTFLGKSGKFGGDEIVDILLKQPVAAKFLAKKFYQEFVSDLEPPAALLEPLAEQIKANDFHMTPVLGFLLRSRIFFSEHAYRRRVKSPTEYVVGMVKALDANQIATETLATSMENLGQMLFEPPNVKGWDGGQDWLNTATLLERHNFAWKIVGGETYPYASQVAPIELVESQAGKDPVKQVDFLLNLFLQGDVAPQVRQKLVAFHKEGKPFDEQKAQAREPDLVVAEKKAPEAYESEQPANIHPIRKLAHTILVLPEYQLA